ncbi:hypothetical protein AXF42_Ash007652 [Apostasia shenzhenica]|uniref:Uncharacterized protein n=1 Tax=Apostasia shenzhenica TaxID=1088818 RepID=A0A2I0A633_9ASPA|nr:hypothetical protein AXF42_Ash007652 [Apostasia shenzhenica]
MQQLAVSSNKQTKHVFSLKVNLGLTVYAEEPNVPAMNLSFFIIMGIPIYSTSIQEQKIATHTSSSACKKAR